MKSTLQLVAEHRIRSNRLFPKARVIASIRLAWGAQNGMMAGTRGTKRRQARRKLMQVGSDPANGLRRKHANEIVTTGGFAGIAVAPGLPATLMQNEADAELVALGKQFTDMVELLNEQSLLNEKSAWGDEALLKPLADIGIAIMDTPATTMQGLIVKARIACFAQGSGFWLQIDPDTQPGFPFAMSIVADLVRRYDPELEWTNDLVPSPERARLAGIIRESCERQGSR